MSLTFFQPDGQPDLSTFAGRLRWAMDQAKITSQSDLARKIGVRPQAIQYLIEPKNNATGSKHIASLAAVLNVNSVWLSTGLGDSADPESGGESSNVGPAPDANGDVPLISWVIAGQWDEAVDNFQPGDAEDWLPCIRRHSKNSYALRVKGDSMTAPHGNTRTYPEGSIIFVDPERRMPVNGERIIAKLEGSAEVTFKVFKEEDGRRWLQPLNPSHEPIRDPFKVLGTVIGKWEDE